MATISWVVVSSRRYSRASRSTAPRPPGGQRSNTGGILESARPAFYGTLRAANPTTAPVTLIQVGEILITVEAPDSSIAGLGRRRRRVLPGGALAQRGLLGTARRHAQQPSAGGGESAWWLGAEVLHAHQTIQSGPARSVTQAQVILTGAVAAQVVAADLRAQQCSGAEERPWVAAVGEAARTAVDPDGRRRRRAGLRLLLALTDAPEGDPDVSAAEAVAAVLIARTTLEHERALVTLCGLLDVDPARYRPVLGAAWVLVFGPTLLHVLDEVSDQLGLLRIGKPPQRAGPLRNAQQATVHQMFATGQVSTRTLHAQAGVTKATIARWVHQPPPRPTVSGAGLTTAQCAAAAEIKPATWRSYVHRGQAPPARGGTPARPLWEDSEVQAFLAQRPGPGARTDLRR